MCSDAHACTQTQQRQTMNHYTHKPLALFIAVEYRLRSLAVKGNVCFSQWISCQDCRAALNKVKEEIWSHFKLEIYHARLALETRRSIRRKTRCSRTWWIYCKILSDFFCLCVLFPLLSFVEHLKINHCVSSFVTAFLDNAGGTYFKEDYLPLSKFLPHTLPPSSVSLLPFLSLLLLSLSLHPVLI